MPESPRVHMTHIGLAALALALSAAAAQAAGPECSPLTYGAVVCIVKLVGCENSERVRDVVSEAERFWGNYDDKRYIWITCPNSMVELAEPIPLRGHQGLFNWDVPDELAMRLRINRRANGI